MDVVPGNIYNTGVVTRKLRRGRVWEFVKHSWWRFTPIVVVVDETGRRKGRGEEGWRAYT